MPQIDYQMTGRWLIAGWLVALALFRGAPGVDLAITGLFWHGPEAGFSPLADRWMWEFLRQRLWDVSILVFLATPFALWRALARNRPVLDLPARVWGFVFTLYLLGPLLLVNGFLKAQSGRARPANVTEFGGDRLFTPAGQFADQCSANCSFVSGEVAAAVVLGICLWLALSFWRARLARWLVIYGRVVAVFIPVFVIVQRVGTGRHFASDAVFAALFMLTLAWALHAIFAGQLAPWLARGRGLTGRRS
ncbi:phosphatase PAP2 family protein [Paenirhodobacter sp. CAU 1674]|uniref:phosphatase PAP2 family protein n=1 Tax=Paenirhodobacter sp. CAU 1674 TaxID=3032596 RepID=UPI0023DC68FF|nr:phosphatase PAP2 family protein [Paenirhodobacter sp. CAU 1674]MDF2140571.1 phosphatase PAP2 family protein [Paenirhodobacter sp. CAU 1674]